MPVARMDSYGRQLRLSLLHSLPFALLVLLILTSGTLTFYPDRPLPPLMISWAYIYYWSVFQPDRLSYFTLLIAGLIQDIVIGLPLGVSSLCFMLLRLLVLQWRRRISLLHFFAIWIGFGLVATVMAISMAALAGMALKYFSAELFLQAGYGAALAWLVYPLIHVLCNRIYSVQL